jgi:hypothetical protein
MFDALPRWASMWALAFVIYALLKGLTWQTRRPRHAASWIHAAYLLAWPGMNADRFLAPPSAITPPKPPSAGEWAFAAGKLFAGAAAVALAAAWPSSFAAQIPAQYAGVLRAALGMIGIAFVLHFGLFHLLSCTWRRCGIDAPPLMNWPIAAASLGEFWGRRWNLAFRDLSHTFVFRPLLRRLTPHGAQLAAFAVSGFVHDLVISWPAGGGWGGPTLYFLLQACGLSLEQSRPARPLGLGRGTTGRLFCAIVVLAPVGLLFHGPFRDRVILPFLSALGSLP